jgi:hypothetical protein
VIVADTVAGETRTIAVADFSILAGGPAGPRYRNDRKRHPRDGSGMKVIHDISLTGRAVQCRGMAAEALFPADGRSLWVDVEATSAFQDTAGTIPAAYGQSVARIDDIGPNGLNGLQNSTTARPLLGRRLSRLRKAALSTRAGGPHSCGSI